MLRAADSGFSGTDPGAPRTIWTVCRKCNHSCVVQLATGICAGLILLASQRWAWASTLANAGDEGFGALAGRPGRLIHSSTGTLAASAGFSFSKFSFKYATN